jgi:hypothetical protein
MTDLVLGNNCSFSPRKLRLFFVLFLNCMIKGMFISVLKGESSILDT